MHIKFVEIQNFRKLKSIRIEFAEKTTLFVGANNSGKTSAMEALGHFLVDKNRFETHDFTLSNWRQINKIGVEWESQSTQPGSEIPTLSEWENVLPSMDVWLQVADNEIHHVIHLLPTLDWKGGLLGVRLRFEPKNIEDLYKDYLFARNAARETILQANSKSTIELWPGTMREFLDRRLNSFFVIRAYTLDPTKCTEPQNGIAHPQHLPVGIEYLDDDPFRGLIRIDDITAQRGLSDVSNKRSQSDSDSQQNRDYGDKRKLSSQLREYYTKHLDPSEFQEPSDLDALQAIDFAQRSFDQKLEEGFSKALLELEGLNYPGISDPKLTISTKIRPMDGLNHPSAVQFEVIDQSGKTRKKPLRLPEQYNGLGYQNLISMVFKLMRFRDGWMQVGKAAKRSSAKATDASFPPLHLVLVEEPEAHLHAQVQQVFIRKAYDVLRNHDDLGIKANLATQMIISTHSSHIAHECEFSCLRYFRRLPAHKDVNEVPTSTVVNLSEVFGKEEKTQRFVTRYLKTTHCDLFFADAAILVEGPTERMLIPYFIRQHFEKLNQSYVTVLEIGGSHAHRLRPLIDHLRLITLVITDLDAAEATGNKSAKQPVRSQKLITRNATLKTWFPKKKLVDELLLLSSDQKVKKEDQFFSIRVAYQCPVSVNLNNANSDEEALSNTFEDALVFENISIFKDLAGHGLIRKFNGAINNSNSTADLGQAMFDALKTGNKAEFALEMLDLKDPNRLKVPTYIKEGLSWLQDQARRKHEEICYSEQKTALNNEGEHS